MKKILSGQIVLRGLLIVLEILIWGYGICGQSDRKDTLFCYTRDSYGNKALIRDNGVVFVEDIFVMEIPSQSWDGNDNVSVTVILEDEEGNQKTKKIWLCGKKH